MRYRAQRYPTRYPVKLKVGAVWFKATATSVSESGICLSVDASVTVGENVLDRMPCGIIRSSCSLGDRKQDRLKICKGDPVSGSKPPAVWIAGLWTCAQTQHIGWFFRNALGATATSLLRRVVPTNLAFACG